MTEEELAGVILGGLQWQDPDASFGTTSQGQKRMADHIARAILSSPLFARMMANAASLENEVGLLQAELQVAAEQARLAAYAECVGIAEGAKQHEDTATPVNSIWWENHGIDRAVAAIRAAAKREKQG